MRCLRHPSPSIVLIATMAAMLAMSPAWSSAQGLSDQAPPLLLDEEALEGLEEELLDSEENRGLFDEELEDEERERSRRSGLRRFFPRWRSGDENERNHRSVRQAFREPVREASRATVQVLANNERVAMGTIVDSRGFVFTKASEMQGDLECRLRDGRRVKAELVSIRDDLDLAVLKLDADDLPVVQWRDLPSPIEGSWLATTGMQEIPTAVGVVSISPRSIPTPQPVLGVMLEDVELGPRVTSVLTDSAAEAAGIQAEDVITDLNGLPMGNREVLVEAILRKRPGDRVTIKVLRGDERVTIIAKLQEKNRLAEGKRIDFQNNLGGRLSDRRWGFPSVIQHDTVLRPTDCGGPVVDLDGRVVGINIARAGRVSSYALPLEVLQPVLKDILSGNLGPLLVEGSGGDVQDQREYLEEAVRQWSERFAELQQRLEAVQGESGEAASVANSAGEGSRDSEVSEKMPMPATQLAGVARLQIATESAKAELEKAIASLRAIEGTAVAAPPSAGSE